MHKATAQPASASTIHVEARLTNLHSYCFYQRMLDHVWAKLQVQAARSLIVKQVVNGATKHSTSTIVRGRIGSLYGAVAGHTVQVRAVP